MKTVECLVFRYLTDADFFNIYKPSGTEVGGGGQSYIDFKAGAITSSQWQTFFSGLTSKPTKNGPRWTFSVSSIGLGSPQDLSIYQRRPQTFAVSSQRIGSAKSSRVPAWQPANGFPEPQNKANRKSCPPRLAIYIVRAVGNEFWAGWFQNSSPCKDPGATKLLQNMLPSAPPKGEAGFIAVSTGALLLDETDKATPFSTPPALKAKPKPQALPKPVSTPPTMPKAAVKRKPRSEEEIVSALFGEDEEYLSPLDDKVKQAIQPIRVRNQKAAKALKDLYKGKCQITGDKYVFLKKDGTPYCEAHHLLPLGEAGADSPYNIVIVNPLIHRMLHYADVSGLDLSSISPENALDIQVNGKTYTIKWHPEHANNVKKHQEGAAGG